MEKGNLYIYTGEGRGKSQAALGCAMQTAMAGGDVVLIQFLKGKAPENFEFIRRLEPELKVFCFEKSDENFEELPEARKTEEIANIKNGIGYAKKVLSTGECDLLILDEVLGLVEKGILETQELKNLLESRGNTRVILTGINMTEEICALADEVSKIETVKTSADRS